MPHISHMRHGTVAKLCVCGTEPALLRPTTLFEHHGAQAQTGTVRRHGDDLANDVRRPTLALRHWWRALAAKIGLDKRLCPVLCQWLMYATSSSWYTESI